MHPRARTLWASPHAKASTRAGGGVPVRAWAGQRFQSCPGIPGLLQNFRLWILGRMPALVWEFDSATGPLWLGRTFLLTCTTQDFRKEQYADKMRRSGWTTQGYRGEHCAGKTRRSGCTTRVFRGELCAGKTRRSGFTTQGFQRACRVMEIRWLACIIREFCGAVHGNDDLEMIWR